LILPLKVGFEVIPEIAKSGAGVSARPAFLDVLMDLNLVQSTF
jgi:hypothetical protein